MDEFQKSRITLLDIAADAEVSRSTVSLVIRNVPSVAKTTRKRVLQSIKNSGMFIIAGESAAELLLKRIEQRVAPIRTPVLQPQLVVRESPAPVTFFLQKNLSKI